MPYSTVADLIQRVDAQFIAELSSDTTVPTIDQIEDQAGTLLREIIADADSEIDSYLGARYVVPITTATRALKRSSCSIASYYLHMRRSWTISPEIKAGYDDAIKWLRDVRNGIAEISTASLPVLPTPGKTSSFQGDARQYTRTKMIGFN